MIPLAVTMTAVKYVAAVYLVVFLFVLAYLLIHVTKLQRLEREVADLSERMQRPRFESEPESEPEAKPGSAGRAGARVG